MPKKKTKSLEQLELEEMLGPSSDSNESQKSKSDLINAGQVASHSKNDNSVGKSSQVHGLNSVKKRGKNNIYLLKSQIYLLMRKLVDFLFQVILVMLTMRRILIMQLILTLMPMLT